MKTKLTSQSNDTKCNENIFKKVFEVIPQGTWRSYLQTDVYRTLDGRAYFEFGFLQVGNRIEIDIIDMPSYGDRANDLHSTHRMKNPRGGYQLDLPNPSNCYRIEIAKDLAKEWAELTWKYIRTGEPFGSQLTARNGDKNGDNNNLSNNVEVQRPT